MLLLRIESFSNACMWAAAASSCGRLQRPRGKFFFLSGVSVLLFISNAYAQTAPAGAGGGDLMSTLTSVAPMILVFVVGFFFMVRPQMKKQKELRNLLENLAPGDEVVTTGGLLGKVSRVKDGNVELQIAKDVEVVMQKQAVAQVLPKGSIRF
jgi:preprotein translocase subunit YajC